MSTKRDRSEEEEVQQRTAPPGLVVYEAIYREAEHELDRASAGLAWSGLAAGLSMGFSMLTQAMLRATVHDVEWMPFISPFGYAIGFLIVILGRQQLFTENTLTPILPLLKELKPRMLLNVGRLWGVVLATNLLGGFLFAQVVAHTRVVDPAVRAICAELGREAMAHDFGTTLLRGIFAGWLIALMVWLLPFAESARTSVIIIISYLIGLGGLPHIIAGGIESYYLVAIDEISFFACVTEYLLPTLLGNTIGGVALVAALVHAQFIASEMK